MKNTLLFISFLCISTTIAMAQPNLTLELFASGLREPVDITNAGDDRLFVVERGGRIKIVNADGTVEETSFLDIDARVNSGAGERGLLGLAFHPDFANNGFFFVNYTDSNGASQISRFKVSDNNPNVANASSEKKILTVGQPFSNHNAGDLAFGFDNFLYVGMGDGGSGGDPGNRSQTRSNLLGKMLRIDINTDEETPYTVPDDNPFVNDENTRDEIWAIGLRNPWRYSFDKMTGDLWIADVGQGAWEEINFQARESNGGENYGWRCYEANATFNTSGCGPIGQFTPPAYAYAQNPGDCGGSVTGGFVYRGTTYTDIIGHYIYGDYCTGVISAISPDGNGGWNNQDLLNWNDFQISSFGQDVNGELYMAAVGQGRIYQITTDVINKTAKAIGLKKVSFSPNPFKDVLRLEVEAQQEADYQVSLFNTKGQELFKYQETIGRYFEKNYNWASLPSGIYYIRLQKDNQSSSWKVLKQ